MPTARTADQIRRDHPGMHAVTAGMLALVETAAAAGEPCPSNYEMGEALIVSKDTICKRWSRLAASGLIEVEKTSGGRRRVHVFATGLSTADIKAAPPPTAFVAVNGWSEADDARLIRLYQEGSRFTDIATMLGRTHGSTATRIYRLIDLGQMQHRGTEQRPSVSARLKGSQNKSATMAAKRLGAAGPQGLTFGPRLPPLAHKPADLDPRAGILPPATACAWFVGPRDGDWRLQVCCGEPIEPGKPYCSHHQAAAWRSGTSAALYVPATIGGDRTVRHGHRRSAVVAY